MSDDRPPVTARIDQALLFIGKRSHVVGYKLRTSGLVNEEMKANNEELMAATSSTNQIEAAALLNLLVSDGLLEFDTIMGAGGYRLTAAGWRRLSQLQNDGDASGQAFIAMWFSSETDAAYKDGIAPAVRKTGFFPMRVDQKEHVNKIDDEIIAEIRRSRFLVADFTSERGKPRGGVYFEAGFAQGLKKPVIWTCRADMIDDVHFDTRQFNHITWQDPADLRDRLSKRIGAVIGQGPYAAQ